MKHPHGSEATNQHVGRGQALQTVGMKLF